MGQALSEAGRWRAVELSMEAAVPTGLASCALALLYQLSASPSAAAPFSLFELAVVLSTIGALLAWMAGRQTWLSGERRVGRAAAAGLAAAFAGLMGVGSSSNAAFEKACTKDLGGVVQVLAPRRWVGVEICQTGGVDANAALRGAILRARWDGSLPLVLWPVVALVSGGCAIGLRRSRLRPTGVPKRLVELLELSPAGGLSTAIGEPTPADGHVVACANQTWWGASCGQLYSAQKAWSPGEWCRRCRLPFRAHGGALTVHVVAPTSSDVTELNAMERIDTLSWAPGSQPRTLGSSVSGRPRWVTLGQLTVPSNLPAAQLIALAHDLLPVWAKVASPEAAEAIARAQGSASRVVAWLWGGPVADRLHVATPTRSVMLISGGQRLKELVGSGSGLLTLQLDLGVLPIEVREGYVHHLLPESLSDVDEPWRSRRYIAGNLQYTTWIATRPEGQGQDGAWVPRVEGEALLRWLRRARPPRTDALPRGATRPAPYTPWSDPRHMRARVGLLGLEPSALGAGARHPELLVSELSGVADPALADLDLVVLRASPGSLQDLAQIEEIRRQDGAVAIVVLSPDATWPPDRIAHYGLRAALHLPLEPDEPEELVFQARDALGARLERGRAAMGEPSAASLDYALTPLQGQSRLPAGPSEPTLQVQPRLYSGEPSELEPALGAELPLGASLSEWDWFELPHIARLRREVVVLVDPSTPLGGAP